MDRPEDNILDENLAKKKLQAVLAGDDPAAVELLWDYYAGDLFAYLQAVLRSRHDAEDVLQTVFVRIVGKRHRLANARCLDAYVFRIARNEAVRFASRRKKGRTVEVKSESWLMAKESQAEPSDLAEQLQVALARLPRRQREVIVMKVYRQKTFSDIARLLGLSVNTVASRYRYGIEKLRTLLRDITP
jgi:RNA polymerase sigma-70 factor, ECF subfamily